jgi:tetratricopeptide (TPR) repeat protein
LIRQLDEAVAHCRHTSTYPKHIATYRLLGKAHLEQQRISDATDIFQRVLSAIPDDFIANVGMSIIREDENNLDASIWHMELAYEAQPSNIAIQDELRRLYGRRDGMQPPKVRLTRGALARMYAKGGLIEQSTAELRSAIAEDPNRPDLQLLLADMFFQNSQRVEAVEICANILKKLPFCLADNQILAVCLPDSEGSDMRKNYRQNAISMDPYYAFAGQEAITSDQVTENAVNIEKLEWKSGIQAAEAPAQPAWATSLGIALSKPEVEKLRLAERSRSHFEC